MKKPVGGTTPLGQKLFINCLFVCKFTYDDVFIKVYDLIILIILITIVPVKPHAVVSKRQPRAVFS